MENENQPTDAQSQEQVLKHDNDELMRTTKILTTWAEKQAKGILKSRELSGAAETRQSFWPLIKRGWIGGFVSGVNAGFEFGYKTANKLSQGLLDKSRAILAGTEAEDIRERNAEIKRVLGEAIGEASTCWSNPEGAGVFQSDMAEAIVDRLYAQFATPEAQGEPESQERLPGV